MTFSKQTIIIAFILSAGLFAIGVYTWDSFTMLVLPVTNDAIYVSTSLNTQFWDSIVFGLTLALIPAATVFVWKFALLFKTRRKILTICIIILAMIISILIRREVIKS